MPFDGVEYQRAPGLVLPYAHHPLAPLTGDALSSSLRSAYFAGRHNGRLVFQTVYPLNRRQPALTSALQTGFAQPTWVRVGEGWRRLEENVTHVCAHVAWHMAVRSPATAHHRIVVVKSGGGSTDTGADVTRVSRTADEIQEDISASITVQRAGRVTPFALGTYSTEVSVALANVALPTAVEVYVEGYAISDVDASAAPYQPWLVSAWWECRG